jgi:hypothetical protein
MRDMACWAESLGDCSEKISREHIVSEGMFPEQILLIKGLHWCENEFKEISVTNFVKKVLCGWHNNSLTDVDQSGIDAMTAFRNEVQVNNARAPMKAVRWTVKNIAIDGRGLERWCLKTLINVAAEGKYKIGKDSETIGMPSARLVMIAFGKERFRPRAGLYGIGRLGNLKISDHFRLIPYVNHKQILLGGLFGIHGYQFILYLEEEGLNSSMTVPDLDGGPDRVTQTLYPLLQVNFMLGKYLSHAFKFVYK